MRKLMPLGLAALLCVSVALVGCGGSGETSSGASAASGTPASGAAASGQADAGGGTTSGPPYAEPASVAVATFDEAEAVVKGNAAIDVSTCSQGYVGASATASSRLKLLITKDGQSYNYDMPQDGSPIIAPMNMGEGTYKIQVMQNTSGSNYAEIAGTTQNVVLDDPFAPFLHPNIFCNYTPESACVKQAFTLAQNAENQGDVVRAIYDWMTSTITYDKVKAGELASVTGYVPDPDETLSAKTGICFDYASLAAAMFRSLGIPCQIVTGYVSPNDIYHAWNMIYIDGEWVSAEITVGPDEWTRIDLTFAAADGGNSSTIGDGTAYTERYVY